MIYIYSLKMTVLVIFICIFSFDDSFSQNNLIDKTYLPINDADIESTILFIDALPKLFPINETSKNISFSQFKSDLLTAISSQDQLFILSILDSNILNSFGGDGGIEEFKSLWKIDNSSSQFWSIFKSTFDLGGFFSVDKLEFTFPYLTMAFPEELDSFTYGVIITDSAKVFRSTNENSNFHTTNYTILEKLEWSEIGLDKDATYIPVVIGIYRYGFVKKRDFRSPIDYRGRFIFKENSWKLKSFVAGD